MSHAAGTCVAIIGAGVAGLVTAVNMHREGIQPTVFEKASDLGGMWNSQLQPCWKSMRTNISKFSVALSGFPWPQATPLFPSQAEVFAYLSRYVKQSLPLDVFRFQTEVTRIAQSDGRWIVQSRTNDGQSTSDEFDFVVVASGFFGLPHIPARIVGLSSFPGTLMHSSAYRSPEQIDGRRVVLVGASMSAAEIAADMAPRAKEIIHVVPHGFWSVPRLIPSLPHDPTSPFLPIDLVFYRRSKRTSTQETVIRTAEQHRRQHDNLRMIAGGDQPSMALGNTSDLTPPFLAISDTYAQWNRAGNITLQQGRLVQVNDDGSLLLNNGTPIPATSDDILVLCTGFRPHLSFLPPDILNELSYTPDDLFCPLILHRGVFHPTLPKLAFVGMYRGAFWSVIELQARWAAAIFSGRLTAPALAVQHIGLETARRIRAQQPRPQFPHSDYVGLVDDLAKEILPTAVADSSDIVLPAQYRSTGPDQSVMDEVNTLCAEAHTGRFVAGAVFRALLNSKWTFERVLTGKPSNGVVRGRAQFHFSQPHELLYQEQGKLTLPSQTPLDISQKYIYRYAEDSDVLSVYFVDGNNRSAALFHTLHFEPKTPSSIDWQANGKHLCSADHYSAAYSFVFTGVTLSRLQIAYTVKGPAKDYISQTVFEPEAICE